MKNFLCVFVALVLCMPTALAFDATFPTTVPQGTTMEIVIPKQDIASVTGTLNKKSIKFFEISRTAADHDGMSRGEFLQLLFAVHDFPEVQTFAPVTFPDIEGDEPYAAAVLHAKALGFVQGYEDGSFHPHDSLTRAQAAKILVNAFNPPMVLERPVVFADMSPRHSLVAYMYHAIRAQLFQGYGDGTVKPDRPLTVSEAEILVRRATLVTELPPREVKSFYRGLIGLHRINDAGIKPLVLTARLQNGATEEIRADIQVGTIQYRTDSFSLPGSKTALFEDKAYNTTWAMIDGAKKTTDTNQLWVGNFIEPAKGEISLGFGDKLIINGSYAGSHFGIDYANVTGTPVYASNSGRVTLSEYTPSYGNTVILDHGHNVFTMYMHLSELSVAKDQMVRKGDLVGKIGATGIATGPHLHFTHFIGEVIVNSEQWFRGEF